MLFLGALALGASACTPDIAQDPPRSPEDSVVAEFDPTGSPPVVPSPNDLAIVNGLVNAPINPQASAAEQEFTRDYVNSLNGFPTTVTASTLIRNLDPTTVNTNTVKIIDVYAGTPLAKPATPRALGYDPERGLINIFPPEPAWPKGGRYAVAIIGGENGVKTTAGRQVIPSATWSFASSTESLVTCQDLTAPNCQTATELIPSTETDPARRLADQTASALRLEQLRRGYAPILNVVSEQFGVKREDIVLLWTFTIMDQPEATFDPAGSVIPFPNDLLRVPATETAPARLNLPVPADPGPAQSLIAGLNTLDGWSTTAPIVSENSATRGPLEPGARLHDASIRLKVGFAPDPEGSTRDTRSNLRFVKLSNLTSGTNPQVKACISCEPLVAGLTPVEGSPQQLQIVPEVPLDEGTQYAVVMMSGLKDEDGRYVAPTPAQALMRMASPLVDANGKSQLAAVPDALAAQLEPARQGLKPLFDALEAGGLPRKDINLAWAFTTQTTRPVLERLNVAPTQVPADPVYLVDQTANIKGTMQGLTLDNEAVGRVFIGAYHSPYILDDTQGTLNRAQPRIDRVPFMLFTPAAAAPEGGYPVVVFGHGLTGNRTNIMTVANNFNAAGYAVAAIDTVFHGERSTCAGISPTSPVFVDANRDGTPEFVATTPDEACSDDSTCDLTVGAPTYGRCISADRPACSLDTSPTGPLHGDVFCGSQGLGRCLGAPGDTTGVCEGGDFARPGPNQAPFASGTGFLNLVNLFATRDNFRHHVVDFAQFVRALDADSLSGRLGLAGVSPLNTSQFHYVGQSLGGIQGALSASVSPVVARTALNAPGGDLVDILLTATDPTFVRYRTGFFQSLAGIGRAPGTPEFYEFITLARTILDPASPRNYGVYLENAPSAPANREAFIQYIAGDMVMPNPVTEGLINAANNPLVNASAPRTVQSYMVPNDTPLPLDVRHAFFGIVDPSLPPDSTTSRVLKAVRDSAQNQVIQFLNTGTAPSP
ncbi:Lipase-like protein [Myxococcus hansupus]|uniref:Lipase-like protein n=1 Tax=Pseudomyxococcus hansupus TaxID=1297742 RepID=A0A0H4X9C1_9BACT|nr:Lipase-like protein [Myxococcus hansupus]